jgi:hypothetical protein
MALDVSARFQIPSKSFHWKTERYVYCQDLMVVTIKRYEYVVVWIGNWI